MTLDESDGEIRGSVTNEQGEVCQLPWEKGGEGVHFGLILTEQNTQKTVGQ